VRQRLVVSNRYRSPTVVLRRDASAIKRGDIPLWILTITLYISRIARRSEQWIHNRNDRWRMVFHRDHLRASNAVARAIRRRPGTRNRQFLGAGARCCYISKTYHRCKRTTHGCGGRTGMGRQGAVIAFDGDVGRTSNAWGHVCTDYGDGLATTAGTAFGAGYQHGNRASSADRNATGGFAGAPQVGRRSGGCTKLGGLPLADGQVAGNGTKRQRIYGDGPATAAGTAFGAGYQHGNRAGSADRDATGGFAGAPQVGRRSGGCTKLRGLPLADGQVAGNGTKRQRIYGDGLATAAGTALGAGYQHGNRAGSADRDATGSFAGAPQVGRCSGGRTKLRGLALADG